MERLFENKYEKMQAPCDILSHQNGAWVLKHLMCLSAEIEGLGDCKCYDHQTWAVQEIPSEEVWDFLQGDLSRMGGDFMADIVLHEIDNQHGDQVPCDILTCQNGTWTLRRLMCLSAESRGLGTCRCNSHRTWEEEEISSEEAWRLLDRWKQGKYLG